MRSFHLSAGRSVLVAAAALLGTGARAAPDAAPETLRQARTVVVVLDERTPLQGAQVTRAVRSALAETGLDVIRVQVAALPDAPLERQALLARHAAAQAALLALLCDFSRQPVEVELLDVATGQVDRRHIDPRSVGSAGVPLVIGAIARASADAALRRGQRVSGTPPAAPPPLGLRLELGYQARPLAGALPLAHNLELRPSLRLGARWEAWIRYSTGLATERERDGVALQLHRQSLGVGLAHARQLGWLRVAVQAALVGDLYLHLAGPAGDAAAPRELGFDPAAALESAASASLPIWGPLSLSARAGAALYFWQPTWVQAPGGGAPLFSSSNLQPLLEVGLSAALL